MLSACGSLFVCVIACVRACLRVCLRGCVVAWLRVCVCVCLLVCVCVWCVCGAVSLLRCVGWFDVVLLCRVDGALCCCVGIMLVWCLFVCVCGRVCA